MLYAFGLSQGCTIMTSNANNYGIFCVKKSDFFSDGGTISLWGKMKKWSESLSHRAEKGRSQRINIFTPRVVVILIRQAAVYPQLVQMIMFVSQKIPVKGHFLRFGPNKRVLLYLHSSFFSHRASLLCCLVTDN